MEHCLRIKPIKVTFSPGFSSREYIGLFTKLWLKNLKGREHLKDLAVDGRIILG
jgi:hypothetical protein